MQHSLLAAATALWLLTAGAGLHKVWSYSVAPGAAAQPPYHWPGTSRLAPPAGHPVLLVIAHPHCPCTRATVGELARLMSHVGGQISTTVLFLRPRGASLDWAKTDLWSSAAEIPGVRVWSDENGDEARRFGASTSGQTLLYDGDGRLVFSGGITAARGHFGDNAGSQAVSGFVSDGQAGATTPVFGCPLRDPAPHCAKEGGRCQS